VVQWGHDSLAKLYVPDSNATKAQISGFKAGASGEGNKFSYAIIAGGTLTEAMRVTSGGTLQIAGGGNDNVGEINMGNTAQNASRCTKCVTKRQRTGI
jgi:hypothetical protein